MVMNLQPVLSFHPKVRTTSFGIETIAYLGSRLWQLLPQEIKQPDTLPIFKKRIRRLQGVECNCGHCKTYIPQVGYLTGYLYQVVKNINFPLIYIYSRLHNSSIVEGAFSRRFFCLRDHMVTSDWPTWKCRHPIRLYRKISCPCPNWDFRNVLSKTAFLHNDLKLLNAF